MKTVTFLFSLSLILLLINTPALIAQWKYPSTKRTPAADTYFGKSVSDNYRWLEKLEDPEVQSWFKSQHDFTEDILTKIPGREALIKEFTRLDAMEPANISDINRKNGRYFYKKTLPSEAVGKLYYRPEKNGKEVLLFDPTEGTAGKSVSISFYAPSEDGKYLAIGIAEGGSESATIRVMNVATKEFYTERISPCWFGVTGWTTDNKGFLYNQMQPGDLHAMNRELNTRMFYHVVDTDPKEDREILSAAKYPALGMKPEEIPVVSFSDDHRYIFANFASVQNELSIFTASADELLKPTIAWKRLLSPSDEVTDFTLDGTDLFLLSHNKAPKFKILGTKITDPDVKHAVEIAAEGTDKIESISRAKDYLLVAVTNGVNDFLRQYNFRTKTWEDVTPPLTGTIGVTSFDITSNDFLVTITSWNKPVTLYDYDPASRAFAKSVFHQDVSYPGIDDIVVEEVEATSHDGAKVPLSITYNKQVVKNGNACCLLSGYGAYGISTKPAFSIFGLALMNKGIIIARAHVRGGGEKGNDWYQAGYKTTKPNTWKDFIACAEYLVKNKYTSPAKLFGMGTSAGGILIGRAITERPDLFGAAICNVGCLNALRMENSPNGPINTKEFGTVQDSTECMALAEMDAFQHVKEGTAYPAVICVGGMNDPRVIVWQPGKFAAALQNATSSGKPVVMQVNYDNGHFTEDKNVSYRNFAGMYAFCLWQTGHPDFQPKP